MRDHKRAQEGKEGHSLGGRGVGARGASLIYFKMSNLSHVFLKKITVT